MTWLIYAMFMIEGGTLNGGFIDNFKFNTKGECLSFYNNNKTILDTYIITQIGNQLDVGVRYRIEDVGCLDTGKKIET